MTLIKSDTGRLVFDMQPVALDIFINQFFEEAKVLAETKKIKVKLEYSEPVRVMGDAARLKQLFLNIIDNAIKYTRPHGLVTLSLAREENNAVVIIKDDGIGIPPVEQEKIFERFYRVEHDGERSEDDSGSGLGLPIAKWIAEAHRGTIEVKSQEGKGSMFIVKLPVL
jgi:signal transduction histidine kinase